MKIADFMNKMLKAFPEAVVGTDNEGQLIIYTNLQQKENGDVVPFEDPNLSGV